MWNPPWGASNPGARRECLEDWGGEPSKAGDKTNLPGTKDGRPEDWGADLPKAGTRRVLQGREASTSRRRAMVSEHDDKDGPGCVEMGGR